MNSYTKTSINIISTHIIVSILKYKYSYKCMYPCFIIVCIHKNNFQNLYLYHQERLFSSLRIMHVPKNVSLKTPRLCKITQKITL